MAKYVTQRVLLMLMTLLIITCICFVLIRMLPPAELPLNDIHTQVIEARREAQGYNKPYMVQFGIFLKNVVTRWDWGVSDKLYFGSDVAAKFAEKLPATVFVNLYSILFSIPLGIALGIFAALKKNTWVDYSISTLTMVVISVPSFVFAFLIQYFLSYKLGWFPFLMKEGTNYFSWSMFVSMLPAVLSLSFGVIASFTRTTRAELCGLTIGKTTRDEVIAMLGEAKETRVYDEDAARDRMLPAGESLFYELSGKILQAHIGEDGTLAGVILRGAMPEELY